MKKIKNLSEEKIKKIAKLSKLKVNKKEVKIYSKQINQVLSYISQLNEVNTDNIEPLTQVLDIDGFKRDDIIKPSINKKCVLENAPETESDFIVVPEIIKSK